MKTIIPLLTFIVLASLEVQAGDFDQPGSTFPTVTPATNNLANINTTPALTNWPAINRPAITNWPATNQPTIPDPPTGLHVQVVG